MTGSAGLEQGYRRLLAWYPRAFRRDHADEILGVLMAGAGEGQRRPRLAEAADLLWSGLKMRLRGPALTGESRPWSDALALFSPQTQIHERCQTHPTGKSPRCCRCGILCLKRALDSTMDSMNGQHRYRNLGAGVRPNSQAVMLSVLLSIWHPNGWFWIDSMDGIDWYPV